MSHRNLRAIKLALGFAATVGLVISLGACSIHEGNKDNGDKHVDIETPVGGLHVSKEADPRDIGLPVYPGARVKEKEAEGQEKSGNVNISSDFFGLKVVAIEYESQDPPDKVIAFYKNQMKKYGDILECHTSKHGGHMSAEVDSNKNKDDSKLKCEGSGGDTIELKVGTQDNQHLVSITPEEKGASFALVYVRTRGKDTI
jgi:hypothetical protein